MRNLSLTQLKTLDTIARTGGFTAAARELNLTQSAVSVQVRELERRLGVTLLERMGKTAYPTAAGRELLKHAVDLFSRAEEAAVAMRRYREGWLGTVRIGSSTTALIYHLPRVLADLRSEHPNVELHLTGGTTQRVCERLATNEIDIGVATLPVERGDLVVTPLLTEPLAAVFPPGARGVPDVVDPETMRKWPLLLELGHARVKQMVVAWLTVDGAPPRPTMELDNIEAVVRMVEAGLGASLVPASIVTDAAHRRLLVSRPLDPPLYRQIGMILRADKPDTPALAHVRAALLTLRDRPVRDLS